MTADVTSWSWTSADEPDGQTLGKGASGYCAGRWPTHADQMYPKYQMSVTLKDRNTKFRTAPKGVGSGEVTAS